MVWKLFVIGGDGNKGLIANRIVLKDLVIIEFVIVLSSFNSPKTSR